MAVIFPESSFVGSVAPENTTTLWGAKVIPLLDHPLVTSDPERTSVVSSIFCPADPVELIMLGTARI